MSTYQPSEHFKENLRLLDDYLIIRWSEASETMEIWSFIPDKQPIQEHKFCRNNKNRKKPLFNWDMEWIVINQLRHARRWQFVDAGKFQDEMLENRERTKQKGQAEADEKFTDFLADDYWHKKRLQERDNNDLGACTTKWGGANFYPGGN